MTDPLTQLSKVTVAEGSFRKQTLSYVGNILRGPEVPVALKAFTVVILAIFILYSFEFCIFVLHVICAAEHWVREVDPIKYLYVFSAQGVVGSAFAIPLINRMDSFGESKRLEADLLPIADGKSLNRRRRSIGAGKAGADH
jgi:hypothetical protein